MKTEDLTLNMIGGQMHLSVSREVVRAATWAARLGWGDIMCHAFVTALVMTDNLSDRDRWPMVMRKIQDLRTAHDLAALEEGKTITRDVE